MTDNEYRILKLASRYPDILRRFLNDIDLRERKQYAEFFLCYADIHKSVASMPHCLLMLDSADIASEGDKDMEYQAKMKRLELTGAPGSLEYASELKSFYDAWKRSRSFPARGADILMKMGIDGEKRKEFKESLQMFRKAAKRYETLGQDYNLSAALFNCASMLYELGRYADSIKLCHEALDAGGSLFSDLRTGIYLQLGNSCEALNEMAGALTYYNTASAGSLEAQNIQQATGIMYRLGWIALDLGRKESAATLLGLTLQLKKFADWALANVKKHYARAEVLRAMDMRNKAKIFYAASLTLAPYTSGGFAQKAKFGLYLLSSSPLKEAMAYTAKPFLINYFTTVSDEYYNTGWEGEKLSPWKMPMPKRTDAETQELIGLLKNLQYCSKKETLPVFRRQQKALAKYMQK